MATRVDNGPRMTTAEFDRLFESVKNWGRWGPDDQRGSLNYITPEQVRAATALVRSGRTASMALEAGTQVAADNPRPALHFMTMMADWGMPNPLGAFCDFVGMEMHGDAHSHIDALCHFLYRGQAYQGMRPEEVTTQGANRFGMGVTRHGIVGRGVLIDVPRLRGVTWMEPGEAVLPEELAAAEKAQGVTIRQGDIVLLRSGHVRRRRELGPWDASLAKAGLHPTAMAWLGERKIGGFGADGDGDCVPSPVEGVAYPIHVLGMVALGLWFMDSLQFEDLVAACEQEGRWEFLCVIAPLRFDRATGSPVNPIAIF